MNNAYVYVHRRKDTGEVFYVGKGTGWRENEKRKRNSLWNQIVEQYGYSIHRVDDKISHEQAFELEQFLISWIGRVDLGTGSLVNKNAGGTGGGEVSDDFRKYMSEVSKQTAARPNVRKNILAANRRINSDPAVAAKISAALKIVKNTPEAKAKTSELAKISHAKPGVKEKLAESLKRHHQDPEVKAKRKISAKESNNRPEVKKKISESLKLYLSTPEGMAKRKAAINTPEVKAKVSASKKLWWANATPEQIAERSRKRKETIAAKRSKQ